MDAGVPDARKAASDPRDDGAIRRELVTMLPRLRRFALSLTGSRHDADDLLQAALERALVRLHLWQPGTRLDSWMYRIIQNVRIDQVRAEKRRARESSLDDAPRESLGDGSRGEPEHRITLELTLEAMQKLSDDHRAVLALVCIEGLRYREAAQVLEVSVGTVMSRLARARQKLHALVDGGPGDAGGASG